LGDERLERRLLSLARDFYARPQTRMPEACQSRSKTKSAYRFFDHPEMHIHVLLKPHCEAAQQRVAAEKAVLAVQVTTSLSYSTHPATENLGPIGSQKEGIIGMLVHSTMTFNLEGTPLGLLDVQCSRARRRHLRPKVRTQAASHRRKGELEMAEQFPAGGRGTAALPGYATRQCWRPRDLYELFHEALKDAQSPWLLIRAAQDRRLAEGQQQQVSWLEQQTVAGIQEIQVPRHGKQAARVARLEVRFAQVSLQPPKSKKSLGALTLWAVLPQEVEAPPGIAPLRWMLLTTCPVESFEAACEKLHWYTLRWGIEVFHRTLKSGCRIEERQLGAADRIQACLAIDLVVAWRIFHLAKLGREIPDVPCTVYFENAQWKALVAYITRNSVPPARPPSLREAMRMVAMIGGFSGAKATASRERKACDSACSTSTP
jgi:hypothetical protein